MKKMLSILLSCMMILSMCGSIVYASDKETSVTDGMQCVAQIIPRDAINMTNKAGIYTNEEQTFTLIVSPARSTENEGKYTPQQILIENDIIMIRNSSIDIVGNIIWGQWRILNSGNNINELYIVCDGNNDATKINAVLGENKGTEAEKRIVYLIGNCVLNASELLDDDNKLAKVVIRSCSNVVFDGTYCDSLTWDGSVVVDPAVKYRIFDFKDGECGLQNFSLHCINQTKESNQPELVKQTTPNVQEASFIMDNMRIYNMYCGTNIGWIYSNASNAQVVNNKFYNINVFHDRASMYNIRFMGRCNFNNNSFIGLNNSSSVQGGGFVRLGSNSSFSNNHFKNIYSDIGERVRVSINSTIENNITEESTGTIIFDGAAGSRITNNMFRSSIINDIAINTVGKTEVCGNMFYGCSFVDNNKVVSAISGGISNNKVYESIIDTNRTEPIIYLEGDGVISGNYIELTTTTGVSVPDTYGPYQSDRGNNVIMSNYANTTIFGSIKCNENTSMIANNYPPVQIAE